jgi:D-alanyl-D-alanine carboxypeptidase/D-alanyl-D-alanine-endopeptidase (penicillin-binding protein 4)
VSAVTKRVIIGTLVVLVALASVGALAYALLQDDRVADPASPLPSFTAPGAVVPSAAAEVLPAVDPDATAPTSTGLAAALRPFIASKALGSSVSVDVVDPLTGKHLLSRGVNDARTPASTQKLLTSAAVLTALGADTTIATRALADGTDGVTLVGGGDVLLGAGRSDPGEVAGRAGLATLAEETATALKAAGTKRVSVTLDDSLFTGPRTARGWAPADVTNGFVAPVQALEINAGRVRDEDYAPRTPDPAMAAAKAFVRALEKAGVDVKGAVRRGSAPSGAAVLGEVASAPVGDQVEFALTHSDNTVAEALGRLVADHAGLEPSFADVGKAVLGQIRSLGVPVEGAVMADASGLADGSRIPPATLTGVLARAAGPDDPALRPILSGMPIAAVSGTLAERYGTAGQKPARGVVRAKTGTLSGVSSLAGTVVDADGRLLVFAAMADKVKATVPARTALDALATELATCGCH